MQHPHIVSSLQVLHFTITHEFTELQIGQLTLQACASEHNSTHERLAMQISLQIKLKVGYILNLVI